MKSVYVGLIACLAAAGGAGPAAAQDLKAVTGGTVIGAGGAPIPDAVVIIEGGRITRVGPRTAIGVPANATIVDARGKFVIPGLADMHNHVRSGSLRLQQNPKTNLNVLLAFGVTTVFNPSVNKTEFADLKSATASDSAPLPRFFGTGPMVTVKGDTLGTSDGGATPETEAEARSVVKDLKAAGVDAVKVSRDDASWASKQRLPVMKLEVLNALVSEAHREGLKVYAHAPLLDYAKEVLRAGGDGLLHGIIDKPIDQELIDLLIKNRAVYVPTMSLYEDVADMAAWAKRQSAYDERKVVSAIADGMATPNSVQLVQSILSDTAFTKRRMDIQRANLKKVFDAKVPVVMGTDSGFFGVVMGVSSQIELALMVEAGLTPADALQAATLNAARMLGRDKESGSIEAGKVADLLILDANPLEEIANVRRIHRVVKAGVVHDPAQLLSGFRVLSGPLLPAK